MGARQCRSEANLKGFDRPQRRRQRAGLLFSALCPLIDWLAVVESRGGMTFPQIQPRPLAGVPPRLLLRGLLLLVAEPAGR
eukprot:9424853-Pyramimonas_sp.AAC.1